MVNPRAGYESELLYSSTDSPLKLAVVGGGCAGMAFATVAARRGHIVTMFEGSDAIGGQFNLAKQVPGKEEFHETIRYFSSELNASGVEVRLGERVGAEELVASRFDKVVLATGVEPRPLSIDGADHPKVVLYNEVLSRTRPVGKKVAIIGAGGVGFDVAEFLAHGTDSTPFASKLPDSLPEIDGFLREWGIDSENEGRGGLLAAAADTKIADGREIYLVQRKKGKHGAGLGRTTGWIHRANLKKRGVKMLGGAQYDRIDDAGLHLTVNGESVVLEVDTVVVCAGQVSVNELEGPLAAAGVPTYKIGGAQLAAELDAKRAIDQGSRLAADIENAAPEKVSEYLAPLGTSAKLYQIVSKSM